MLYYVMLYYIYYITSYYITLYCMYYMLQSNILHFTEMKQPQ